MSDTIKEIHINWDGPYTPDAVQEEMDGKTDYGIYQFYGHNPVCGGDTLLYIGKARNHTFARMMKKGEHQVQFDKYWTSDAMSVCVGRLAGETPGLRKWTRRIDIAAMLLVFAHSPAWNSQGLNLSYTKDKDKDKHSLFDVHVFNWGKHKSLLPEVSGRRYARRYPADEDFYPYTV